MPQPVDERGESLNAAAGATRRALFVHGGALGDFILSLRIIETLRQNGATHVTLLGKPRFGRLATPPNGIDEIIDIDTHGMHAFFSADESLPADLAVRLSSFDIAVDTLGGRLPERLREGGIARVVSIDPRPRPDWRDHITEQWLADLRATGLRADPGPPRIELTRDPASIAHLIPDDGARQAEFAVIQPGSGGARKCWPVSHFIDTARHLNSLGMRPVFMLGPVENECMPGAARDGLRSVFPTIDNASLQNAAELIASARLYVGNDSGTTHLAAAVGTPTVAVFGPTDPRLWQPLGSQVTIVAPWAGHNWPTQGRVNDAIHEALQSSR